MVERVGGIKRWLKTLIIAEAFMQRLNLRFEISDFINGLMQLGTAIVHLHRERELFLQRSFRALCARIDRQMQRGGLRFSADGQFHLIITRQRQRSFGSRARIKRARDLYWIVVTQVPGEPVHSFVCWDCLYALDAIRPFRRLLAFPFLLAGKMPDHFA